MNIDTSRLLRLLIAGALAGLIVFCIFNAQMVQVETRQVGEIDFSNPQSGLRALQDSPDKESGAAASLLMIVFSGSFAAMLGGMLALADDVQLPTKRIVVGIVKAVCLGLIVGGGFGVLSQVVFSGLLRVSILFLLLARMLSWATFGVGAGAGLGFALGSWRRAGICVLGGLLGGLVGGGLFDIICLFTIVVTRTGSAGRFIGFIVMGLAVGAAVAFVEDIAKKSWITVLRGPKEGRSFILTKPVTTIGRNEMVDIPLFGDMSIAKDHARLLLEGTGVFVQSATNTTVTVNGSQTQYAQLRPWDVIGVGGISLRFHQKGSASQMAQVMPMPDLASAQFKPSYSSANRATSQPAVVTAAGQLRIVATAGPHINQRFKFGPGTVRIGREVGSGVMLAQDGVVSRNHAEVKWDGKNWIIRDLDSRNGLWVNGVRVTEHTLGTGDQIGVGQSWLKVEGI